MTQQPNAWYYKLALNETCGSAVVPWYMCYSAAVIVLSSTDTT
jgi:hypothetical protein